MIKISKREELIGELRLNKKTVEELRMLKYDLEYSLDNVQDKITFVVANRCRRCKKIRLRCTCKG